LRYYEIIFQDPGTGDQIGKSITTMPNGKFDPNYLNVELDIPVVEMALPVGSAFVRLWGISIAAISQGFNFNGVRILVFGGMSKGLPLSNPKQQGLLLQGVIQNAFGNWQGTTQTLDMIVQFDGGTIADEKNLVLAWGAGTKLADAIKATLSIAFPSYTYNINISDNLVLGHDAPGYYQTIGQFASYVKQASQDIIGGNYQGVSITIRSGTFYVYDGTTPTAPTPIAFVDLIGQPTWLSLFQINFKTAMRGDIAVGDYIQMPPGQSTLSQKSYSQFKQGSVFAGVFQVDKIRHVGNARQPTADAWVTVFDAHAVLS